MYANNLQIPKYICNFVHTFKNIRANDVQYALTNLINIINHKNMKKHLLFVALATIFTINLFAQEPAKPTTVPAAPTKAEKNVMALYCNHYAGNTLKFTAQGWGAQWEVLDIDGTKVVYTQGLAWDAVKGAADSNDLSGYEKIHFDLWAPAEAHVCFTVEALSGYKKAVDFKLNEGWNTIDADTAWWAGYDWKDLKCVLFEQYKNADASASFEGNPFAFANIYFWSATTSVTPPDVPTTPKPDTAPAKPTLAEENVMAMYCNHYATNNLNFNVLGWGGVTTWETLELGDDKTNVLYCQDMKYEFLTNWDKASYDFSGFEKFHFDVWVPFAAHIKVGFEALSMNDGGSGWKKTIDFKVNEGWNTIDCDPAWWISDEAPYDWKDVKYVIFEGYKKQDSENVDECSSAEGNPLAFANLYWWNKPAPQGIPETAPAAPKMAEKNIQALFSATYQDRTFNFAPVSWGSQWIDHSYDNGQHIWFSETFAWDGFTNWDASSYDLNAYDMMHADIYVTVDSKLKITFEALGAGDGGSGWKNGGLVELKANQWNNVEVDLLNAPYDSYDFKDLRFMILEGFVKADGSGSAEGTPLAIANVYFWNTLTPVENVGVEKVAVKRIINGQIVIEKNGVQYNLLGTQF